MSRSVTTPPVRHVVGAAVAAASLLLAACGGSEPVAGDAGHNQADVEFVQQMIPHHEQAVVMSAMAEQRAESEAVVDLAGRMEAAQGPEIEQMREMLEGYGEDPAAVGMDHGDHAGAMPGMMDEGRMGMLEGGRGVAFDRMWLESMVEHHEGAVEMSRTQVEEGRDPEAIELAEQIIDAQEAEIVEMTELLEGS